MQFSQSRINETLDSCRRFWRGERREPMLSVITCPAERQATDIDAMVAAAAARIAADASLDTALSLPCGSPDFGTISTARLYGGEVIPAHDGGGVHIKPVITDRAQLGSLKPTLSFAESDFQRAILYTQRLSQAVGQPVFTRTPDLQGPLNTLALLMDQQQLCTCFYDAPELVDDALDAITDVLIDHVRRYRETIGAERVVGNIWPFVILPDGKGIGITQDYMPMLSPKLYQRFEIPRLKRIAEAFGGVFIHCCGQYGQHVRNLAASGIEILGMEMHAGATDPEQVWAAFGDRIAYVPYIAPQANGRWKDLPDLLNQQAGKPCGQARWWVATCHGWNDVDALRRSLSRLGSAAVTRSVAIDNAVGAMELAVTAKAGP
jgi:hypothetical protein